MLNAPWNLFSAQATSRWPLSSGHFHQLPPITSVFPPQNFPHYLPHSQGVSLLEITSRVCTIVGLFAHCFAFYTDAQTGLRHTKQSWKDKRSPRVVPVVDTAVICKWGGFATTRPLNCDLVRADAFECRWEALRKLADKPNRKWEGGGINGTHWIWRSKVNGRVF